MRAREQSNRFASGFTLIELMVTIAVLAIFMAIAAPSLQRFILQQRIKAAVSEFNRGLMLARAEAIRRNQRVVFAARAANCNDFKDGWQIFVDTGTKDQCFNGTDVLVTQSDPLDTALSVAWQNADANKTYLIFAPTGAAMMSNGSFGASRWTVSVPSDTGIEAKSVCVNAYGRVRTATGAACT